MHYLYILFYTFYLKIPDLIASDTVTPLWDFEWEQS